MGTKIFIGGKGGRSRAVSCPLVREMSESSRGKGLLRTSENELYFFQTVPQDVLCALDILKTIFRRK